ncbi:serine/threonine-protein phosphatase 6 regulatory ankyrin repeat subunit A-like [Schistocerca nitens]|uniref:serine/threonine-protein phosphatase 6 regulatory ankyrin repeat subunit A-like n=1 Tax=Schistocerca nitens TaxID=7011 RepID=UPI0021197A03|nr:serine/threonine-protein phosphatase 6 regulatory ankyrin repeat subunit A-like [Schistocerca nitens]
MLLDVASQLKGQHPSWWILRIDLLKYSEVFDSCGSGIEASKDILLRAVYNRENLGLLEHSLLQYCLLEYPRIICMVDGFDEVCPDYADKCLQALQELSPRRGKLLVTTRSSVTGRLEGALGLLAHTLPAFSEEQLCDFHGWSGSEIGVTEVVRDLLRIPLFSKMYAESFESGITVYDIVSLYEAFFERKFRRMFEEKWLDDLSIAGKKKKIERERREHEQQLGFLAMSHLLPRLEVPRLVQLSSVDRDDLVKAGIIYQFIYDKPVFIHRTFAEYFLAKWCFSDDADGLHKHLYRKALSDNSLEFFVETFDRMASRGRPLLMAVLNGREREVNSLLEKGADPTERDEMGRNSLHLVPAYSDDSAILRLLVEHLGMVRVTTAGGSASGSAEVTRQPVEAEAVSGVDEAARWVEEGRAKESEWVASESGLAEGSRTAGVLGVEEMVGVDGPSLYVEAVKAASVALGAEDGLLRWTPLRYAAERRRWCAVAALLEMGARLQHLGDFQRGLHSAEVLWRIFKEEGYKALFDHVLGKTESGWSPGVGQQPVENKRCLDIKVGVSIVCTEMSEQQYGEIVQEASKNGDAEVATLVWRKQLDTPDKSTNVGSPAVERLEHSTGIGQLDEWRQILHEEGIDGVVQQLARVGGGATLFEVFGDKMLLDAARKGDTECIRQLIEAGADVDFQTGDGARAIHFAAVAGNADCIKWLLSAGADVNVKDKAGSTPQHYAAVRGSAESVRLLLAAGADALLEDSQCVTPLLSAAMLGNAECVRLLACAVRNLESTDLQGFTAMHHAARNGDAESLKHLLRAGARSSPVTGSLNTPLHQAAVTGNAECVRVLLQAGADVAARDADGFTALHFAVLGGNPDCLRHLLAAGADVRAQEASGFTPLHIAAAAGAPDAVRLLLEGGADVNQKNDVGHTPLHHAASQGKAENVKLLLDAGADALAQDSKGRIPLQLPATVTHGECVALLECAIQGRHQIRE